jgi:hypothetical protein
MRDRRSELLVAKESDDPRFATVLDQVRTQARLNVRELARRARVDPSTIHKLIGRWVRPGTGELFATRRTTARQIAQALGFSDIDVFFEPVPERKTG